MLDYFKHLSEYALLCSLIRHPARFRRAEQDATFPRGGEGFGSPIPLREEEHHVSVSLFE